MKRLLYVSAFMEASAGLALLIAPSRVAQLLLGYDLPAAADPLARICGVALLSLGLACGAARTDAPGRVASGIVAAMLTYDIVAAAILALAGVKTHPDATMLWPAVGVHSVMGVWCFICLSRMLLNKPARG